MSHTQHITQDAAGNARLTEAQQLAVSHGDDEKIETSDERGRRWYHPRPEPRRRTDLMGLNATWWMALVWLIVIVVAVFQFPWWW